MKTNSLETTDIFRGAFFLCSGGDLAEIRIRNNGKRIATFLFTGANLDRLDKDYMNGKALVNPVQFRESLNRLRDVMFERLRQSKNPQKAGNEETRYDRKRDDRIRQGRR